MSGYIFGEFYNKIIEQILLKTHTEKANRREPETHQKKSKVNQTMVFESIFEKWAKELSNESKKPDPTMLSRIVNGKQRITTSMQSDIYELYQGNYIEDIIRLIESISRRDIFEYYEEIITNIEWFTITWRLKNPLSIKALLEAKNVVSLIRVKIKELQEQRYSFLSGDERMEIKSNVEDLIFKAIAFAFVASMDIIKTQDSVEIQDIEVIASEFDVPSQTETRFDTSYRDELVNVEVDTSDFSLEYQIRDACTRWITAAKKSGRMIDYSEAEEQHELMDIPLTALIRSTNEVDDETGCTIEEALFGNGDIPNLVLLSPGGGGKSFLMYSLAEKMLDESCAYDLQGYTPLYVPLNKLNGSSQSVFDYCREMLEFYGAPSEAMQVFNGEIEIKPLLLLDGFNEISLPEVQNRVVAEIADFKGKYPSVRFVVSSRYDFSSMFDGRGSAYFSRRELLELNDGVIIAYIQQTLGIDELSATNLWNQQPQKMKIILRRPMALAMFAKIKKHSELSATYPFPKCERLAQLLANYNYLLLKAVITDDNKIIRYTDILSYIGFRMVNDLTFEADIKQLTEWIKYYCGEIDAEKTHEIIAVFEKSVLRRQTGGIYRFAHQNLRDFHAARHIASGLEMIKKGEWLLCEKFFPNVYSDEILTLLGEYTQDYISGCGNINKAIDVLKAHQGDESAYKVIVQLIQTAKIVRNDLHDFDFSGLDLSRISLNGCKLYCINKELTRETACFDKAIISDKTFVPQGHANAVFAMCLVDERFLMSFSQHTICCYDVEIGAYTTVGEFTGHKPTSATYLGDSMFAVADESRKIHVMRCVSRGFGANMRIELLHDISITFPNIVNRIQCVSETRFIAAVQNGCVYSVEKVGENFSIDLLWSMHKGTVWPKDVVCSVSYIKTTQKKGLRAIIERKIYMAYGPKIYVMDLNTQDVSFFCDLNSCETENVYIFDICAIKGGLFVYYETSDRCKVVYFDDSHDDFIECELNETMTSHFEGYSKFNKRGDTDVFICRDDQTTEKPNAYQLLVYKDSEEQTRVTAKALSMGMQQLRVVEGVCLPENKLATCSVDRSIQILDVSGNVPAVYFGGNYNGIHEICMFDEATILCAQYSGEVSLWEQDESEKWYCTHVYSIHNNWVWSVETYTINNNVYIITASYDHTVKITDAITEECIMTAVLDNQVLSARLLSDGRIVTHTFDKVYLMRVRYPVSGEDYCECVEKTVLYEAGASDYIRDICLCDGDHPCVIVAVNNNENKNLAARVLKIELSSDSEPETIAKFEPANENIRQYVIRSMHIENDYIAVGGDIKYNDNSSDKGFCGLIDLKTKETQLYRTGQRISRVKIHDADIPQYIFAVSNSGEFLRLKLSDGIKKARKDIPPERIAYTQLLDIKQCGGDIYIATLDGSIFKLRLKQIDDDPIRKDDMLVITEVVSGFRMCGISMRTAFVHEDYVNIEQKITRYLSDGTRTVF